MQTLGILELVEVISSASIIIPLILAIVTIKIREKTKLSITLLVVIGSITELLNMVFMFKDMNNHFIVRMYTITEVILICLFYFLFYKNHFKSIYLLLILPLFAIVCFIDYVSNGSNNFDNYATSFEAITFTALSLWSFYYITKNTMFDNMIDSYFFWFNGAFLLYFGGNLALFVFNNYLLNNSNSHIALWAIHSVLNIIYNIAVAIGFWKTRQQ
jgi:hypothetical protein